ncbi:MAG: hypothetical protein AAF597_07795, partial [Bacteroidota bacterium]
NPATIMTDQVTADNIYLKPLTKKSIREILDKHHIDAVLPTMGGQTALNLAIDCDKAGIWEHYGVKIIGVSEVEGAIYSKDGFDIHEVIKHRKEHGSILSFPGVEVFGKEDRRSVMEFECDILVPAALENQIRADNAHNVKAKIIGEAANGPVTAGGAEILAERGIIVIPDIYLNAGGVTVSYFEWLKNLSHMRFGRLEKRFDERAYRRIVEQIEATTGKVISDRDKEMIVRGADEIDLVRSGLEETMITGFQGIYEIYRDNDEIKDLRTAAFALAIKKISSDYISLGIWP